MGNKVNLYDHQGDTQVNNTAPGFTVPKTYGKISHLCKREGITIWGDSTTQELIQIADLKIAIKDPKDFKKHKSKLKWICPIFFHLGMNFTWDEDNTLYFPYQIN
jgi:hypothetical protein